MMAKPFLSIDVRVRLPAGRGTGRYGSRRWPLLRHDCLDEWLTEEGIKN